MTQRLGRWQAVPPELGVPIVIGGLAQAVLEVVTAVSGFGRPWRLAFPIFATRTLLMLWGLLELRRRVTGSTAVLIAIAAAVQVMMAATIVAAVFAPLFDKDTRYAMLEIGQQISMVGSMAVPLLLGVATGLWRSIRGVAILAIVTLSSYASVLTYLLSRSVWSIELEALSTGGLALLHAGLMLVVLRRLGAQAEAAADPGRALRGARRATVAFRLRLGVAVTSLVMLGGFDGRTIWAERVSLGLGLATVATIAGVTSGLLGLARAQLADLSPSALCIAAYGAVCGIFIGGPLSDWRYYLMEVEPALMLVAWFGVLCLALAAWQIRRYAIVHRDRVLQATASRCVVGFLALQGAATGCAITQRPLLVLVFQIASVAVLARLFARLGARVAMNAATDVF